MGSCPHKNIVDCPLYHAMHEPAYVALSCDDGELGEGSCAVSRGMDYAQAIAKLRAADPRMVAEIEWRTSVRKMHEQRNRNMQINGIH